MFSRLVDATTDVIPLTGIGQTGVGILVRGLDRGLAWNQHAARRTAEFPTVGESWAASAVTLSRTPLLTALSFQTSVVPLSPRVTDVVEQSTTAGLAVAEASSTEVVRAITADVADAAKTVETVTKLQRTLTNSVAIELLDIDPGYDEPTEPVRIDLDETRGPSENSNSSGDPNRD